MLKSPGRPYLFLSFGQRICVCLGKKHLNGKLLERLRPYTFAGVACWIDKIRRPEFLA